MGALILFWGRGVRVGCLGKTVLCYLWDPLGHYSFWPLYLQLFPTCWAILPLTFHFITTSKSIFITGSHNIQGSCSPPLTFYFQHTEHAGTRTCSPILSFSTSSSLDLYFPTSPFPPQLSVFQEQTPRPRLQSPLEESPTQVREKRFSPQTGLLLPCSITCGKGKSGGCERGPSNLPHRFVELDPEPPSALMGPPANRVHSIQKWPSA